MTPEQVLEQARQSVRFARNLIADIEFSPEDGYRSDPDFLCRVIETVIAEGATTINVPDTVGYAIPELYGAFIKNLSERVPNSDKAVWSVHCHNDLGMAVANSLAAVQIGGARQIECTINGLGERAGNTSLQEVVMAVRTRADFFNLGTKTDTTHILPTWRVAAHKEGGRGEGGGEAGGRQQAGGWGGEPWGRVTMGRASGRGERPRESGALKDSVEKRAEAKGDGRGEATFKAIVSIALKVA